MGLNTAAIILNDKVHDLNSPLAGPAIYAAICQQQPDGAERYGVRLLPCDHSSAMQIVAVGGNCIERLGGGASKDKPEELLRKLAHQMGYRLVKKAAAGVYL